MPKDEFTNPNHEAKEVVEESTKKTCDMCNQEKTEGQVDAASGLWRCNKCIAKHEHSEGKHMKDASQKHCKHCGYGDHNTAHCPKATVVPERLDHDRPTLLHGH